MNETVAVGHPEWEEEVSLMTPYDLQARYLDDVWRFVSSRLDRPEDAEDVTMDVMVSAFKKVEEGKTLENPRLWLLTIAKRRVADMLRRKYRNREVPLQVADDGVDHNLTDRYAVNSILDQMTEDHSQVLVLKYVNGLSTDEVAVVMERTPEATNSLLQRARASFKELSNDTFPDLTDEEENQ